MNGGLLQNIAYSHRQTITYDGFGRKIRVDYSQVPDAMIVGHQSIYADDWYQLTSTREYVGPHVFCDGRLEYSAFPGGYFDPDKGAMYYVTDWQSNNAAVVDKNGTVAQQTIYYPYGEPTIEPEGQRYLYGGKEREHAGGRNAYDFGARCLTPYGNWGVPDPLAEKNYPISPYSMCAGDPINRVDRDGRETHCVYKDSTMNEFAVNYPDNDVINIVAHGNPQLISTGSDNNKVYITTAQQLIDLINDTFDTANGDVLALNDIEIQIFACRTGSDWNETTPPIAQKLSGGINNAFIIAPDCRLGLNSDGTYVGKERFSDNDLPAVQWRVFHRGNEINMEEIPLYKRILANERFFNAQLPNILLKINYAKIPTR